MNYGNLSTALNAGLSGQSLAQKQMATTAHNLTNAQTEGYSRQELKYVSSVLGGVGCGVAPADIIRITDSFKVEQIRTMATDLAKLETINTHYNNLNQYMGEPGQNNSLPSSLNNLKKTIETLIARPEIDGSRSAVIKAAEKLALDLSRLTQVAQDSRRNADAQIYTAVQDANVLMENLFKLNQDIEYAYNQNMSVVDLLDQRDRNLKQLSELMDVRVQFNPIGKISLFSTNGSGLLENQLHKLEFDVTSGINGTTSYANGTMNGILIDGDPLKDIAPGITGGRIGGLLQVRDVEMPAFQSSLDMLTGVVRDEINAAHNKGTATNVPRTLNGTRTGLTAADNIAGTGTVKVAVVDRATGLMIQETVLDLNTIGTIGNINNQLNTMAATAALDVNGALTITANDPNYGIAIASTSAQEAKITSGPKPLGFSHYFGLNDFFVTGNTITGNAAGIAGQLEVRPSIASDISKLANTELDITKAVGERVITSGGNSTLIAMTELFGKEANFAATGKIPNLIISLTDYAASITQYTASEGRHFKFTFENETARYELAETSLESIRGVNMQEEVMNLMQWQRQMKVCTQLITTAEDMMQELLRMKR